MKIEAISELDALEPIEITWLDSYRINLAWMDAEEIEEHQENQDDVFKIHTAGYFYEQTENYVYIIQSYDSDVNQHYDSMLAIPIVSILEIRKLK